MPIINMELKARKPEELLRLINNEQREREVQEGLTERNEEEKNEETRAKRRIKQNPLYKNEDMASIPEEVFGAKAKKKRKGANNTGNDTEYRNTAVTSAAKQG